MKGPSSLFLDKGPQQMELLNCLYSMLQICASLHASLEQALDIARQVRTMKNKSEEGVTNQDRTSGLKNDEDIKEEVISSDSEDCTDRNLPSEGASKRKRRSELELLKD